MIARREDSPRCAGPEDSPSEHNEARLRKQPSFGNTPHPQPRKLRAYPAGDFWKGNVVPLIRLQGQWLRAAGFMPGDEIRVQVVGAGRLVVYKHIGADGAEAGQ